MKLFERANIAVDSTYLGNMDWDQCPMSGLSQNEKAWRALFGEWKISARGYDVALDTISPDVSQDFAFVVE